MLLVILMVKRLFGTFFEKEWQKTSQQELRVDKVVKRNVINYMLCGNTITVHLVVGLIKKR